MHTEANKKTKHSLAAVAQLVGALSHNRNVAGSIPGQDSYIGCGFGPRSGCIQSPVQVCTEGSQSMLLSHIDVSLSSLSFLSF